LNNQYVKVNDHLAHFLVVLLAEVDFFVAFALFPEVDFPFFGVAAAVFFEAFGAAAFLLVYLLGLAVFSPSIPSGSSFYNLLGIDFSFITLSIFNIPWNTFENSFPSCIKAGTE